MVVRHQKNRYCQHEGGEPLQRICHGNPAKQLIAITTSDVPPASFITRSQNETALWLGKANRAGDLSGVEQFHITYIICAPESGTFFCGLMFQHPRNAGSHLKRSHNCLEQ